MAYTTIDKPTDYFNTKLYSADATNTINITGVGHQPDWVWIKRRNGASDHVLFDSVRGTQKGLFSSLTNAEATEGGDRGLTSFDSDGFTIGPQLQDISGSINAPSGTYVSWNWKAGGTASSNTDGSITSSVSASTTAGFSIVSWTGTGTNPSTIGHGLGTAPSCIILKNRDTAGDWYVGHDGIGWTDRLKLNTDQATASTSILWNNTAPTSSVFTISSALNFNGDSTIAYCFAEKKGYSKFGSYTGNGSTDGTFVYTGFKPAWIMIKRTDSASDWIVHDIKRPGYNGLTYALNPNSNSAEATSDDRADFLSNGFKLRTTGTYWNASGGSYIYMAFASNPFVSSTGIPTTAR